MMSPDATQSNHGPAFTSPIMIDVALDARDGQHAQSSHLHESPARYFSDPCLSVAPLHADHRARKVQARFEQLTLRTSPCQSLAVVNEGADDMQRLAMAHPSQYLSQHQSPQHAATKDAMDETLDSPTATFGPLDDDVFGSPEEVFESVRVSNVSIPQFQALGSPAAKRPLRERRHTYHGDALDGWQPGFHPISSPLREGAHLKWH